jgi:hypothetical protein
MTTPTDDAVVLAARMQSTATFQVGAIAAAVALIGTLVTGAVTLISRPPDGAGSATGCEVSAADTAAALDRYDRMQRDGRLTPEESRILRMDAVDEQANDEKTSGCPQ